MKEGKKYKPKLVDLYDRSGETITVDCRMGCNGFYPGDEVFIKNFGRHLQEITVLVVVVDYSNKSLRLMAKTNICFYSIGIWSVTKGKLICRHGQKLIDQGYMAQM
jgi:hypothetical protein